MKHVDTVVVGLGGMGSATLAAVTVPGRRVLGIDRFTPPHTYGSSHSHTRAIRKAYFEDDRYVPLVLEAYALWNAFSDELGTPLIQTTGGLMIGDPESRVVQGSIKSAQRHLLPHQVLDAKAIRARFPLLNPRPSFVGLYETDSGLISPEESVRAYLARAADRGARIWTDTKVTSWESKPDHLEIKSERGTVRADRLIITAGPWANRIVHRNLNLTAYRVVQFWLGVKADARTQAPCFPVHVWDLPEGRCIYAFPNDGRCGVKIGFHEMHQAIDPDAFEREVGPREFDALAPWIEELIPELGHCESTAQSCIYSASPDHHFLVGQDLDEPRVLIAAGFSGHGYKFVPVIARELARRIDGLQPNPDFDLFSLDRPAAQSN